jgi:hypothetical protein
MPGMRLTPRFAVATRLLCLLGPWALVASACGNSGVSGPDGDIAPPLPEASCSSEGGSVDVAEPTLAWTFEDSWQEAWLGSPAIVDLDDDGTIEVLAPRGEALKVWSADGTLLRVHEDFPGRIWASPVVADLRPDLAGLEYAVASRGEIHAFAADGEPLAGFPFSWRDELRALAAGDVDDDGDLELVTVTTSDLEANGQVDILLAIQDDGSIVSGFPPNTTGAAGCTESCYVHAGFDQTLALGDVDGDGSTDILAPQDNAYVSLHDGTGRAFDANSMFEDRDKYSGIRFMLDYELAKQGWGDDGENQAHFTNSAPAIADLDGDGHSEIILLGSVQNVAQDDRERGVVVFVTGPDGTRPEAWEVPFHAEEYLGGLWDLGDNIVAATNQITVADLDPDSAGPELVFAGFDGRIHALSADNRELWRTTYTSSSTTLTGGVLALDLSRDGRPEIVFSTYSTQEDQSALFVLSAGGEILHQVPLSGRGAMPVPSVADLDEDGTLEILVSLKDSADDVELEAYTVSGSGDNCLLWPTGRGNLWRTGNLAP